MSAPTNNESVHGKLDTHQAIRENTQKHHKGNLVIFIAYAIEVRRSRRQNRERVLELWKEDPHTKCLVEWDPEANLGDIFDLRSLFGLSPVPKRKTDPYWDQLVKERFGEE